MKTELKVETYTWCVKTNEYVCIGKIQSCHFGWNVKSQKIGSQRS